MFENLKYNLKHNHRSVLKKGAAWLIFGAIILVFALLQMNPNERGVATGGAVAVVNEASISQAQLYDVMERMQRDPRFQQLQGLGGDAGRQLIQSQALGQLIEIELVRQATEKNRLWTSDMEVREIITSIPSFQQDGRFKRELYLGYLNSARKNASEFEEEIRREQSLARTIRLFGASMKPLALETEKLKGLQAMKANLEFVSLPAESLVMAESISQADIKAYVSQSANEAKIKEHFESNKRDFATEERVKARHILIRAQAGDSEAEKKALAKIEDLAKRAKAEDFAKLAGQFSEDPGSKANGGLLDFFTRGKMVPEFENAAFSLGPNEISRPIKTEYGYHLIQALEKKPAKSYSIDEVRDEIAGKLIARERSREAIEKVQDALKKGDEAAVRAFVASHKLKWEETGAFSIDSDSVPKIGSNDEAVRLAFQLTPEKPMANALVREGSRAFIVRHKPVVADKTPGKKEEKPELMAEMMASRRGEEALRKWVDALRKSAKISTNASLAQ